MAQQTVTRAVESGSEPARLIDFLREAGNIPQWAPVFADKIESIAGSRWRVVKNDQAFEVEIIAHPAAGTVDYIREMPGGKRGGAYIRVTPRPLGGSTVTMTVPIAASAAASEVAGVLEQELAELVRLTQS